MKIIKNQKKAMLFAFAAVLMWSTVATAFKITLSYFSPIQMLWIASSITLLLLTIICFFQGKLSQLKVTFLKRPLFYVAMGLINPFIYYLTLFYAYDLLPAQQAQSLNYTWAIMLSILAVPVLGQKLTRFDISAIILGYLGVLIVATKGDLFTLHFSSGFGVFLALLSTLLWASYWIFNSKNNADPILSLLICFLISVPIIMLFVPILSEYPLITINNWQGWLGAIYIGLFEMGFAFVAWLMAMRYAQNTAKISNLIFISPFISLILLNQLVGEEIYPATIVGLLLIIIGLIVQQIRSTR
jgi:drug/metabolite transporter (DMT)-like permease